MTPADNAHSVNQGHAESVAKGMRLERERIVCWLMWRGLTATAADVVSGVHWHYDDDPEVEA